MSNLLEHAKTELELAGYNISEQGCNPKDSKDPMDGYANACAKSAYELIETLSKQGHSGMSVGITLRIFNRLANYQNIEPLTNNPDEWQKLSGCEDSDWQNKRNPACFTTDFKTYYNVDDKDNKIKGEDGYWKKKPKDQWVKHPLKDYKEFLEHR